MQDENANTSTENGDGEDIQVIQLDELDELGDKPLTKPVPKERHAFHLGVVIVWTFAISIGLSFLYLFIGPSDLNDGLEIFKTISSVLSGPLGFVLAYYFRAGEISSG